MNSGINSTASDQGCICELTPVEGSVCRMIFTRLLESGQAPTVEETAASLGKAPEEVASVLDALEKKDLLVMSKQRREIVAIYPISLTPTKHTVIFRDQSRLFANCAVDALSMPNMFDRDATIISRCEECEEEVRIQIESGEIAAQSHANILIWRADRQEAPAAETCCPLVNFFCSDDHLEVWKAGNPDLAERGHSVTLAQAYPAIRDCWKRYGATIQVRGA